MKCNPNMETIKAKCHYACHSWYLCENLLQNISIYWNILVSILIIGRMSVHRLIFSSPFQEKGFYDDSVICINKKLANISGIFLDMPQNIIGLKIKIYHTVNRLRSFLSFGSFRSIDCVIQVIWVIRVIQVIQ